MRKVARQTVEPDTGDVHGKSKSLKKDEVIETLQNKKSKTPPLDLFGITPRFYISGDIKIQSWVGCILSSLQIATVCLIMIVFLN
jgi:hypothetical protein